MVGLNDLGLNKEKIKEMLNDKSKLKEWINSLPENQKTMGLELLKNPDRIIDVLKDLPEEEKKDLKVIKESVNEILMQQFKEDVKENGKEETVSGGEIYQFIQDYKDLSLFEFYKKINVELDKSETGKKFNKIFRAIWIFNSLVKKGKITLKKSEGDDDK